MKSADPRIALSRKAEEALAKLRKVKGERDPVMGMFPENFAEATKATKLSDLDALDNFFRAKRNGFSDAKAAHIAGLSKFTIYEWKTAGLEELERREKGEEPRQDREPHIIFLAAYSEATYAPVREALEMIHDDITVNKNVDTAKWLLERLAPEDYGRITRHEIATLASKEVTDTRVAALPAPQADQLRGLDIIEGTYEILKDGE